MGLRRVKTVQVGSKLFILDGISRLRYVDLETNVVHQYPRKKTPRLYYRIKEDK